MPNRKSPRSFFAASRGTWISDSILFEVLIAIMENNGVKVNTACCKPQSRQLCTAPTSGWTTSTKAWLGAGENFLANSA